VVQLSRVVDVEVPERERERKEKERMRVGERRAQSAETSKRNRKQAMELPTHSMR
jgi:hypothetical protein